MKPMYYVGLDVHKRTISYCVKDQLGRIVREGRIGASRSELEQWRKGLPDNWVGAMEATLFTGWIYDYLTAQGAQMKVADPSMLKALTASKKKNDRIDARKIADLLRCDLLPECYMARREIRELRRILRYRRLLVRQCVQMKNRIAGFLMETGMTYDSRRLHGRKYFQQLLQELEGVVPESVTQMLGLSRSSVELLRKMERQLIQGLLSQPLLEERVQRLSSIPGVGVVTALSWALEVGEPQRFGSVSQAVSYCGLCSAQMRSAEKDYRSPISKKRNPHLQHVLVEAAKLAPRWNAPLAAVHNQALERGNRNRATLAVARKLVALPARGGSQRQAVSEQSRGWVRFPSRLTNSGPEAKPWSAIDSKQLPASPGLCRTVRRSAKTRCAQRPVSGLAGSPNLIFCEGHARPIQQMDVWSPTALTPAERLTAACGSAAAISSPGRVTGQLRLSLDFYLSWMSYTANRGFAVRWDRPPGLSGPFFSKVLSCCVSRVVILKRVHPPTNDSHRRPSTDPDPGPYRKMTKRGGRAA